MFDTDERRLKNINMRFNYKKVAAIGASVLLTGMTMGVAAAASFPAPYSASTSSGVAVVSGSGAGVDDTVATSSIADYLATMVMTTATTSGGEGVTEDEVILGGQIDATGYKIESILTDSKITSLLDEKISWDDGTGSTDYDIHEEIRIGNMEILTSFNDEDLKGVALTNTIGGLAYRYVFDDVFNVS
ncbi:hypothetical protein IH970_06600, partial [candidate division KSB1 bacterium]|nr:hypothetical protein [candidate division KSB1 bacterium]